MLTMILRLNEVKKITGISRSSIYRKIAIGAFPLPIRLGKCSIGWVESEIAEWIQQQIEQRNQRR